MDTTHMSFNKFIAFFIQFGIVMGLIFTINSPGLGTMFSILATVWPFIYNEFLPKENEGK